MKKFALISSTLVALCLAAGTAYADPDGIERHDNEVNEQVEHTDKVEGVEKTERNEVGERRQRGERPDRAGHDVRGRDHRGRNR